MYLILKGKNKEGKEWVIGDWQFPEHIDPEDWNDEKYCRVECTLEDIRAGRMNDIGKKIEEHIRLSVIEDGWT